MEQQKQSEDVRFWVSGNDAPAAAGSDSYLAERIQNTSFLIHGSNVYDATDDVISFTAASQASSPFTHLRFAFPSTADASEIIVTCDEAIES